MKRHLLTILLVALMLPLRAATPPAATGQSAYSLLESKHGNRAPRSSSTPVRLSGEGSISNPHLITSVSDFLALNSESTTGKYYKLTADIDFNNAQNQTFLTSFDGCFDGDGHKLSNLIINASSQGTSIFGAAGNTSVIKNLTVENAVVTSTGSCTAVIVGTSDGTIENCRVINAKVTSPLVTGAIAGIGYIIKDCEVKNITIDCKGGYCGGLAGEVDKSISNSSAVEINIKAGGAGYPAGILTGQLFKAQAIDSYAQGYLDAGFTLQNSAMNAGGITGIAFMSEIRRCFALSDIKTFDTSACSGALVGSAKGSSITDCYATGNVENIASKMTGGLVGYIRSAVDDDQKEYKSSISNCWTSTSLVAKTTDYNPEIEFREVIGVADADGITKITGIYFDRQVFNLKSSKFGTSTAILTSASGPGALSADNWIFGNNLYPRLRSIPANSVSNISTSAILCIPDNSLNKINAITPLSLAGSTQAFLLNEGSLTKEGTYAYIEDNELKLRPNMYGAETLVICDNGMQLRRTIRTCPFAFDGEGTIDNPYILSSAEHLISLSEASTTSGVDFTDTYFKFDCDIDLAKSDKFLGLGNSKSNTKNKFNGVIDGNGHTLHGLYMKGGAKTESGASQLTTYYAAAFVGRLDAAGIIKNLSIAADAHIEGYSYVGPFVGNCEGKVINCRNYADVSGYSCYVGGIVGSLAKTGSITDCFNAGNITTGYHSVGGIAGDCNGLIENCANTGAVSAVEISLFGNTSLKVAGGIAGVTSGARLVDVMNAGTVTASLNNAGGIAGSLPKATTAKAGLNDVVGAINFGTVICPDKLTSGAIAGVGGTTGEVSNVYWDSQLLPLKAAANAEMTGTVPSTLSSLISADALPGITSLRWKLEAGKYPVLALFATEPTVIAAASAIVDFGKEKTAEDVKTDATLSSDNGINWKLSQSTDFKIEGNILHGVPQPMGYITDILTAQSNGYTKHIPISSLPSNPLFGEGTSENPFTIKTAQEWIALEGFMRATANSMEGQHIALAENLDFKNLDIKPFGSDGITPFNAILNGNGHTLSNVSISTLTAANTGLFALTGTKCRIENLNLDSSCTISGKGNTGSIVGLLKGELYNCHSAAKVTSTAANTGGIVGNADAGTKVINATYSGNLTSSASYTGGIVGLAKGTAQSIVVIDSIKNTGSLSASNTYLGGIIGSAAYTNITKAFNEANLSFSKNYAGGIVAYAADEVNVSKAFNHGNISATSYAAGIVGYGTKKPVLTECINSGDISVTTYEAAGLIGHTADAVITRCANFGNISNTKAALAGTTTYGGASGIVARGNITAVDVYNTGNISASNNLGSFQGIYGSTSVQSTVSNAYTTGDIIPYQATATQLNIGIYHGRVAADKEPVYNNIAYDSQHLTTYQDAATAMTTSQLMAHTPGQEWINPGQYCYPVLKWCSESPEVLLHSAAIALDEADNRNHVTHSFFVGTPQGVEWSGDPEVFSIEGNKVSVKSGAIGNYQLTATSGNHTRNIQLTLDVPSGCNNIDVVKDIVKVIYTSIDGIIIETPAIGCPVIETTVYSDGTSTCRKTIYQIK